ncbi:hypothetical protein ETAA8_65720 [Anatilimnocola aggregata]|uniref:Uncharacterized protein n=1 Tax=Anatilimnocola aggregata TaxID=2528021 RepID=A0A517YMG6_9BACT|nr:hypothetical protein [Anatilimnocola aggregata]QDU31415.1 hypothetical protein ETAA8_65720 [Anatilimnocola aggregata]
MSIVACPRCRDEVTLPAKVSPQARVRCPLCRDEYILSEALAKMPPTLIVLDPGPGLDEPTYGSGTAYDEPEYKVAGDTAPGGMFDTTPPGEGAAAAAPRPLKGTTRPKKKSGSPVGQVIQVVMGGVGAIVLFHALAWYTPLGLGDPLEAGPLVAKYIPAIVPEKYRGTKKTKPTDDSADTNGSNNIKKFAPPVPAVVKGKKKNGGNSFDPDGKFSQLENPAVPVIDPLDPGAAPVLAPETDVKIEDPLKMVEPTKTAEPPLVVDTEKPVDFTPPPPKPEDPNAKPVVGSFELTTAYAMAVAKREAFDQAAGADAATRKQKGLEMFESAAELGKVASQADLAEAELQDKASEIKEFSLLLSGKLQFVNFFAAERLAATEGNDGIAFGGTVTDFKSVGDMFETTIEIARKSGPLSVAVVTPKSLQDQGAKVGDTAVVIGRIVRDVPKDLPKYKGEASMVVHGGHTTIVPMQ